MRLTQELKTISPLTTDDIKNLTVSGRQALIRLCESIGQLQRIAPDVLPPGPDVAFSPSRCQALLEQLIDVCLSDTSAAPAVSLRLAYDAVYARSFFRSDSRYSDVLDRCFEYLDTVLGLTGDAGEETLSAPCSTDIAALISDILSTVTLSDEDAAPYLAALKRAGHDLPASSCSPQQDAATPAAGTASRADADSLESRLASLSALAESALTYTRNNP